MSLQVPGLDEAVLGGLFYFFEKAVAISGRLLGVNPFDQPGVEAPGFQRIEDLLRLFLTAEL